MSYALFGILADEILALVSDDWVMAAEVIGVARDSGATDPIDLRDLSVGLVSRLIVEGFVEPGDFSSGHFRPWVTSPGESIARIVADWTSREGNWSGGR